MRQFLAIIILLLASPLWAADHYYRADCANSGDGTTLACAGSPGGAGAWKTWQDNSCSVAFTPVRGDTYYFAGSDTVYDYVCIRQASGSGELTLKKVTSAQSEVAGYEATHASKQAVLGYGLQIRAVSNVTIDGVAPTTAAKTGHGFKIVRTNGNISTILVGSGYTRNTLTFRGIEITSNPATLENCYASKTCNMALELKDTNAVTVQGVYAHHMMGCIISSGIYDITVDGLYCQYNDSTAANHSNAWSAHYTHDIVIKNSIFEDIEGTAFISNLTANTYNWEIYNNVFFFSTDNPESREGTGHGIFTTNVDTNDIYNFKFYSNTIANINLGLYAMVYLRGGCSSNCEIRNNLWYCTGASCKAANNSTGTHITSSNNFYSDAISHNNETDHYGDANDPFTNYAGKDFSLADASTPLDKGYALGPPYNSDILGTARPQVSSYDIGAYERTTSTGDVTAPTVTAFVIPSTATSLTVPISSFTCTDAVGVTGYCARPAADPENCSWSGTAPSSVTFTATGAQTARGYCKDAAANVSTAATDTVTITLPTTKLPWRTP